MILARWQVHLRRRARVCRAFARKLLSTRAEEQLFSVSVRYLDRGFLTRYGPDFACDRAARDRAARLLASHLTDAQRRTLRKHRFFFVTGRSGRRFRVWARRQLPVELISAPNSHDQLPLLYCVNNDLSDSGGVLPLADYLLELKLCLEADEKFFLMTSNPNFEDGRIEKSELLRESRRKPIAG
jgi:hypothetical protein